MKREDLVKNMQDMGKYLIDNADKLVPDVDFITSVYVSAELVSNTESFNVDVNVSALPENYIRRIQGEILE